MITFVKLKRKGLSNGSSNTADRRTRGRSGERMNVKRDTLVQYIDELEKLAA
jgi:hypothetical protein